MINTDSLSKKILIIHDRFQFRGGAERLVLILAQALQADIATEFWTEESFSKTEAPRQVFVLDKKEPSAIVWRYFRAHKNFLIKTRSFIKNYDLVIFSGNNCLTASFNLNKNTPKIYYCHSPVRYVYDLLSERRAQEKSLWKKFLYYTLGIHFIRAIYRLGLKRMTKVVANSENVKNRLMKYCHTKSEVINPPIETDKFKWLGQADYYLSSARLDNLKRVADIVEAFIQMPKKKLIICSGGEELNKIEELAGGHKNIDIKGWVEDQELANLTGNCVASIYIPIDEDFGMTPVESMSAGKPVIGVAEGGLKETIIENVTGLLIQPNYQITDIVKAVEKLTPDRALNMKADCIKQADRFRTDIFINKMKSIIEYYPL